MAELGPLEKPVKLETPATQEQPEEQVKLAEPVKPDPKEMQVPKVFRV
jgi:hypothetical protein